MKWKSAVYNRTHQPAISGPARVTLVGLVAFAAAAIGGCGGFGVASSVTNLAKVSCAKASPVGYASLDLSTTGRSPTLISQRVSAIHDWLLPIAACSGSARVVAFSGSIAASQTLFDGSLAAKGATTNARLRRVPGIVHSAMSTIDKNVQSALRDLPPGGSDILGQLQLAREFHDQVGDEHPLVVLLATDGIQTTNNLTLNSQSLSTANARALGARVSVPTLRGASVTVTSIGQTAGAPPPSGYVDALKVFWRTLCHRTNAHCLVVTQFERSQE